MKIKNFHIRITFIILLLFSCDNPIDVKKPDKLIDQALMEKILYEATLLEVMSTFSEKNPNFTKTLGAPYFYLKYGIDSLQLSENESYYSKNPKIYQKIHMKVLLRMEKLKDSFDILTKKEK